MHAWMEHVLSHFNNALTQENLRYSNRAVNHSNRAANLIENIFIDIIIETMRMYMYIHAIKI